MSVCILIKSEHRLNLAYTDRGGRIRFDVGLFIVVGVIEYAVDDLTRFFLLSRIGVRSNDGGKRSSRDDIYIYIYIYIYIVELGLSPKRRHNQRFAINY